MRISAPFFFLVLFATTNLFAQGDSTSRSEHEATYYNNFLAGGLLGEEGESASLTFSTTHGIRYKRLTAGAGIGYDSYHDWSILPLYASVGIDLNEVGGNVIYLHANGGYAVAVWRPSNRDIQFDIDADGGIMVNPMIGYSIKAGRYRLYMAGGYKFQRINYSITGFSVQEDMERIVIQLGFGWH